MSAADLASSGTSWTAAQTSPGAAPSGRSRTLGVATTDAVSYVAILLGPVAVGALLGTGVWWMRGRRNRKR